MDKKSAIKALTDPQNKETYITPTTMVKALNVTESPQPSTMIADKRNPPSELEESWGFHLLMNCSECNGKIDSPKDIEMFFDKLIKAMKMKKLTDFVFKKVEGEDGRGVSGFQMITTSHIAMHFDDEKRSGYLDIFSCKDFDSDMVVKMVKEYFQPKHIASQLIYRDAGLGTGNVKGNLK